jgi:hypothetical protein
VSFRFCVQKIPGLRRGGHQGQLCFFCTHLTINSLTMSSNNYFLLDIVNL